VLAKGRGPMKFHIDTEIDAAGPISEARFAALADALYDLEDGDPAVEDADLGAALTSGHATVSMTVDAADAAEAGTKALCVVRTAIHATGDATPGWETARTAMHITPAEESVLG
jgi:hypothetical protein